MVSQVRRESWLTGLALAVIVTLTDHVRRGHWGVTHSVDAITFMSCTPFLTRALPHSDAIGPRFAKNPCQPLITPKV